MKTLRRIVGFMAIVLSLALSCTKQDVTYEDSLWCGEYPAQTLNGTTGELEDQTAVILLQFSGGGQTCSVFHGYVGLLGMSYVRYDVNWSSEASFSLSRSAGGQTIISYSGEIGGNTMSLDAYNCDGIADSYVLKRSN